MAARKPRRNKDGTFAKGPARKPAARKAAPRKAAPRKAAPRKAARRRNPPRPKAPQIMDTLMKGGIQASQILVGEAVVRSVPQLAGMPKEGPMGLAVQAGTALVAGYVATMFLSRSAAAAITAGGLAAPIRTFIVAQDFPWIGRALSPVQVQANVGAYVMPKRIPRRVAPPKPGVGVYANRLPMMGPVIGA